MEATQSKHILLSGILAIALLLTALLSSLVRAPRSIRRAVRDTPGSARTFATSFQSAANPISDSGNWLNGGKDSLDWTNVRSIPGLAFGTESGSNGYDDSTALLTGTWRPNQAVRATVHSVNQQSGSIYEEVELRLRSTLSAHRSGGYEVNFRCTMDGTQYVQIVRWNGPLGNFSYVSRTRGPGIRNGDMIAASIVGSTITAYINNVPVLQGTDDTYAEGNPGIGFYLQGAAGLNLDCGFTDLMAVDESPAATIN